MIEGRAALSVTLALLVICANGAMAAGQMVGGQSPMPVAPGPAVFGGAQERDPQAPQLTFSAQALGGYDDNIAAGESGGLGGFNDPARQVSSSFAGGGASLQFNQARSRVSYSGVLGAQYRQLFDVEDFDVHAYTAQVSGAARVTKRSSVFIAAMGGVQPFYQFGLTPRFDTTSGLEAEPFAPDMQASPVQVLRYAGDMGYRYEIGPRTSFQALVSALGFEPVDDGGDRRLFTQGARSAGGRVEHRLSENLAIRTGYFYRTFNRGSVSRRFESHDIDLGLNYTRTFDLARRTRLSIASGSSVVRGTAGFGSDQLRTRAFVTGNANLTRTFLRTWSSRLTYARGANYIEGLQDLALTDLVSASTSGLFADRLDASFGVQWLSGTRAFEGGRFTTFGGGGQLRFALTRNVAAFTSYTFARYRFPEGFVLPVGFDRNVERQGVRVGLSLWTDLLR